ncbi:unnamed protein product [Spirodela intermedia]|uniref:Uncharacterized protein n=1 Tax=Spirodela intermedia TaxID=51605 RepID=A0A7I8JD35_SPIIN|nr:unnamed protein product [Spirodela intermedia]CAA6668057.1 unnamed protein product [Spirodela intermedia]
MSRRARVITDDYRNPPMALWSTPLSCCHRLRNGRRRRRSKRRIFLTGS